MHKININHNIFNRREFILLFYYFINFFFYNDDSFRKCKRLSLFNAALLLLFRRD